MDRGVGIFAVGEGVAVDIDDRAVFDG